MRTPYPAASFYFNVSVERTDARDAAFAEVSGLDTEMSTEEIAEGGENRFSHVVPVRAKHGNLVLKRGLLKTSAALFAWVAEVQENGLSLKIAPRTIVVSLLDEEGDPLVTWNLARCWPVKMQMSSLKAQDGEIAIETLEFSYAYLTRKYDND